ncbi:MAG: PQQ-binding-like beta-propeller repeat protein [Pirellulaceae bacterium]|nr:PQQ-binding-like beta-propeller repeat protein [Pirellulaceae bacterium]
MRNMLASPRLALSIALLTTTFTTGNSLAEDWPEFRGPNGQGIYAAKELPLKWSKTEGVKWRTELPGNGWSSPIVVKGIVYVTAAVPVTQGANEKPDLDLMLMMIDVQSGKLLKSVKIFTQSGADSPGIHSKNSHASPTPLVDEDRLYLHFGHQGTACTDLQGKILWSNKELSYPPVHGNGGSPVVADKLLIFSRDGADISEVTALDKMTGKVVWKRERDVPADKKFSFCTPLVLEAAGKKQLILPGSNVVQSLVPETGEEIWRLTYDGYSVIPRPIYADGLVFVCTGYNRPSLLAIDPTGTGDVTTTHLKWKSDANVPHTPSLVASGGKIFMVSDKGIASGVESATGKEVWKERIGGNFSASPLLVGDRMYMLSEEGDATILQVGDTPTELAKNKLTERCLASPAIVGNDLLIRSANALYRVTSNN